MLKDIKKNKIVWIVVAVVVVILITGLVAVLVNRGSKEPGNPDANAGTESDKDGGDNDRDQDDKDSENEDNSKPYEGSGLEVGEYGETPMESIDASGSWDDTPDSQAGSDDGAANGNVNDNKDSENGDNNSENGDNNSGVSGGDVLEGGSWTKPR